MSSLFRLKAAMKAVVATSRMHEGSKRRTDSCEISASGTSRQSSMQQDPPPGSTSPTPEISGPTPNLKQATPTETPTQQHHQDEQTKPAAPSPPRSPKPLPGNSDVITANPAPIRPPLRADGSRPASVISKNILIQAQRSLSAVDPAPNAEVTPPLATPPSPNSLSNGFSSEAEADNRQ